jgi:predicted lipoprotein with Yx(FWY)xxD motif
MRSLALAILGAAVAACGTRDHATTDSAAGAAATPPPATGASAAANGSMAMLDVGKLPGGGEYLTDAQGRAVYVFEKDKKDSSTCVGDCAAAWPPLISSGAPMAHSSAIEAAKLGTIARPDGSRQATYDGKPLYYFARDQAPGDIKGQDVKGFGGEWYLVKPSGEKQESKK